MSRKAMIRLGLLSSVLGGIVILAALSETGIATEENQAAGRSADVVGSESSVGAGKAAQSPAPQQGRRGRGGFGAYKLRLEDHWLAGNTKFWYRNDLARGAKEFILVNAKAGTKEPAFDHDKLAAALSDRVESDFDGDHLPFDEIVFTDDEKFIRVHAEGGIWECSLENYACKRIGDAPQDNGDGRRGRGRRGGRGGTGEAAPLAEEANSWPHGLLGEVPSDANQLVLAGNEFDVFEEEADAAPSTLSPQRQGRGRAGRGGQGRPWVSPDGKWSAFVRENNVFVRKVSAERADDSNDGANDAESTESDAEEVQLSFDGEEGNSYASFSWSPDSKTLAAFRIERGDQLQVHFVESSPAEGGRAILHSRNYALPGDKFTAYELNLFEIEDANHIKPELERVDFGRPRLRWSEDGKSFTYQKVDRGHQRFRVIRVDATTGDSSNIIDEQTETFIWTAHGGWPYVNYLDDSGEIIYASEKNGWRHLYLYDAETGQLKNQITQGEWVVRGIDELDEENRQIWFRASGMKADQDPYLIHYYRVNFDGSGLTALTDGNGDHSISYSPDKTYLIDSYSRADAPPIHELRRVDDGSFILELEKADVSQLEATGWKPPEVFTAKGRDGETDIWGLIHRPADFDPEKNYPIIEYIYAGPHDSHVPKSFSPGTRFANLHRLGFIVVQIDGMGTANRSKAFHDVCWHNLKDAGFPDRIAWIKAAAEKYPYMDTDNVGIYGTSAGGQNSTGALLFHGDFYKAAVSACGCHDNRMDKASWNEQWMGYPVGPHYGESSNIDNAGKLVGHLLLIVGEMDTNVPPESTYRLVDALIKANKDFDFLAIPGGGHTSGGRYGTRRLEDFFVRHLQGVEPPNRNAAQPAGRGGRAGGSARGGLLPVSISNQDANSTQADQQDGQQDDESAQESDQEPVDLNEHLTPTGSRVQIVADWYAADQRSLSGFYSISLSPIRFERLGRFYTDWDDALQQLDTSTLSEAEAADLEALRELIKQHEQELAEQRELAAEVAPWVNFASPIILLAENRARVQKFDHQEAAGILDQLIRHVRDLRAALPASDGEQTDEDADAEDSIGAKAAEATSELRSALAAWHDFYHGYDPMFSWWMRAAYPVLDDELRQYADDLQASLLATSDFDPQSLPAYSGKSPAADGLLARAGSSVPDLAALMSQPQSEFTGVRQQLRGGRARSGREGRGGRGRGGQGVFAAQSPEERLASVKRSLASLDTLDFAALSRPAQVDYLMSAIDLRNQLNSFEQTSALETTLAQLAPFRSVAGQLAPLPRAQRGFGRGRRGARGGRRGAGTNAQQQQPAPTFASDEDALALLQGIATDIPSAQEAAASVPEAVTDIGVYRQIVESITNTQSAMQRWKDNRDEQEEEPSAELTEAFEAAEQALRGYARWWEGGEPGQANDATQAARVALAKRNLENNTDPDGIIGRPIGKAALERALADEMIAYSPEELIRLAYVELEWCHNEMRQAAREMGLGDDWQAAVEKVKGMHVAPGEQPFMIRDLAWEAIDYLRENDLITVPQIATEVWRMQMMSPQRQLVNPFFTGGQTISVSFPTDTMAHEDKLQSMRGNNHPFAKATVHHELIPGHHLQGYMGQRNIYQRGGGTPFWGEGWALYWELVLYDKGFPITPEERIGMLVWRSHRCARIVFSLSYHMGLMNPQQCIDFLVANVGFERNNSEAEVRRSFNGSYSPLYQAAYLLGGLQLWQLRQELVETGKLGEKEFHDAIIRNGSMPIEMVRAAVSDEEFSADYMPSWRFHHAVQ